ncbi:MAG: hypothetical protein QW728_04820, partial [Thermoplasmata archaeon]
LAPGPGVSNRVQEEAALPLILPLPSTPLSAGTQKAAVKKCPNCGTGLGENQRSCIRCSVQSMMSEVQKELNSAQAEGINIIDARSLFEEALNDFELEDYNTCRKKLMAVHDKVILNKELHSLALSEYDSTQKELKALYELGVSCENAESMLAQARAAMVTGDYDLSIEKSREAMEKVRDAKKEGASKQIENEIRKLEESCASLENKQLVTTSVRTKISTVSAHLKNKEYEKALVELNDARKELRRIEIEYKSLNFNLALVEALSAYISSKGKMNLGLKELIHQSGSFFEKGDYSRSAQMAADVILVVKELCPETKEVLSSIEKASKSIFSLFRDNPEVIAARAEYFLDQSLLFLADSNLSKALEAAEESHHSVEKALTQYRQATEVLRTFEITLNKAKENGVDVLRSSEFMEKARFCLSKGLYRDVIENVRLSEKALYLSREQMEVYQDILAALKEIEVAIKEAKRKNLDLSKANYFVEHARTQLDFGRYDRARKYLDNAAMIIKKIERTAHQTEEILKMYETEIKAIENKGYDVKDAKISMENAFDALSKGQFGIAIGHARDAERLAHEAVKAVKKAGEVKAGPVEDTDIQKRAEILKLYTQVEELLTKATALKMNTSEIEMEMNQIREMLDKKELDEAKELLKSIEVLLSMRIKRELQKKGQS